MHKNPGQGARQIPAWAWIAAVALLLVAAYTTWQMRQFDRQLAALRRRAAQELQRGAAFASERERYQQALNIIADRETRQRPLKPANASLPAMTAYWNPKTGLVLASEKMHGLASGRTLQLWVVPPEGAPVSAGILRPDAEGQMLMVMPPSAAMSRARSVAITEEPAGGSPQPTSAPLWSGPVS